MKVTKEIEQEIINQYNAGYTYNHIANMYDISAVCVGKYVAKARENGLIKREKHSQPMAKKNRNGSIYDVKFKSEKSEQDYKAVLKLYVKNMTNKEISKEVGISPNMVRYYVSVGSAKGDIELRGCPYKMPKDKIKQIYQMWNDGCRRYDIIGKEVGYSKDDVGHIIRKAIKNGNVNYGKAVRCNRELDYSKIIDMYNAGYTYKEMAKEMGVATNTIYSILSRQEKDGNVSLNRSRHIPEILKDEIVDMYRSGYTYKEVAETYDISYVSVYNMVHKTEK